MLVSVDGSYIYLFIFNENWLLPKTGHTLVITRKYHYQNKGMFWVSRRVIHSVLTRSGHYQKRGLFVSVDGSHIGCNEKMSLPKQAKKKLLGVSRRVIHWF